MKNIFFILFCFIILIITSTIGYQIVSANEMIIEEKDIVFEQNEKDSYISSYGYTIDNPNIIINPYDISPLTALISFETTDEVSVTATVNGKDNDTTYVNTFSKNKKHFIPIYGLYANFENKVTISYNNIKKDFIIKTDSLPSDFQVKKNTGITSLTFISEGDYPYAVDQNNDVRWILTKKYSGEISRLSNGNFLLGSDSLLFNQKSREVLELDLFGKIYHQYAIDSGYYGSFAEVGSRLFILSDSLLEIDQQNGYILNSFNLEKDYHMLLYNEKDNLLELKGKEGLVIRLDTLEKALKNDIVEKNEHFVTEQFYLNNEEYKVFKGFKFFNYNVTTVSNKNIFLIGYKKADYIYSKYDIKIQKFADYLKITGKFNDNDEVYVILDKFLSKKVYDMNHNLLIINKNNLHGKYSIYMQINGIIYKTDYYVYF